MNRILTLLIAISLVCVLPSCRDKNDEPKSPAATQRTVLIYAVASNNLSSDLAADKREMISAAPLVAGLEKDVRVLLYSVASQSATEATLAELKKDPAGEWSFHTLKSYDRNTFSTDPARMREVFADLRTVSPADNYGLILWSHGTGWIPNFSDHQVPGAMQKSYGMDKYQGVTDYCDIDELAYAIPDGMFDYIWFDLCYMMGVEVVYQLRNKCDYIAGYPTEDWSMGMNYDTTLPMLAAPRPDLAGAGKAFYDYYMEQNMAVTVTVMKTDGLDRLAQAAADIYAAGTCPATPSGLQNYSRLKTPLYDFGQYTKRYLNFSDPAAAELEAEFDEALRAITIYAGCSTKNFNGTNNAFDPAKYSGLSCYFPGSATASIDDYYDTLDWPSRVYSTQRTVLVYAVASNNLSSDLASDKKEMLRAAPNVPGLGRDVRVVLYSVPSQAATEATLAELKKDSTGEWSFQPLKSYDRNTFSTDPVRMREVFADLRSEAPAENYGLILWSHGTGWIPNFADHQVPGGMQKSYGMDKYQGVTDYCDIDELAYAIPDGLFDYIWFDLCYMMGVEVVYQFRNKCDYIAGYPTEDWSMGMNYDTTLPMLAAPKPDLEGAGKAFYDYYMEQNMAVTVTVMKTDGLDRLAQAAADIYAAGTCPATPSGLQNYSRLKTPLYDFGQYTKRYLNFSDPAAAELEAEFDEALRAITIYAGCSTKNFNGTNNAFDPAKYSGLSCYFPGSATAAINDYYETLDWPKRVNP